MAVGRGHPSSRGSRYAREGIQRPPCSNVGRRLRSGPLGLFPTAEKKKAWSPQLETLELSSNGQNLEGRSLGTICLLRTLSFVRMS